MEVLTGPDNSGGGEFFLAGYAESSAMGHRGRID